MQTEDSKINSSCKVSFQGLEEYLKLKECKVDKTDWHYPIGVPAYETVFVYALRPGVLSCCC